MTDTHTTKPTPLPHAVKLRAALEFLGRRYACHHLTTFHYTPSNQTDIRVTIPKIARAR